MATASLSSAIYNASTHKYLVVLENAVLIKNDRTHHRLTIELDEANVTVKSTPRFSTGLASKRYSYGIQSAMILPTNIQNIGIIAEDDSKNGTDVNEEPTPMPLAMHLKPNVSTCHIIIPKHRLSQSGTSPVHHNNPNIIKPNPSQRLSSFFKLANFNSPLHKTNVIKRMLQSTDMDATDLAMYLPAKYEDKYTLNRKINDGLQGTIHSVQCRGTRAQYCMKTMKYRNMYQLRQHLERYLIIIQHQFMDYKDIFVDILNHKLHIIQPLFEQTITEKLCSLKSRKFSKSQLNTIIAQLIEKIDVMHSAGYIHHDIKPGNIMFDGDGKLHVIDFDLMGKIGSEIASKGTIGFMAPEMLLPKICSEASMDIWSIGSVLCYIAFQGNIPFNNIIGDNGQRIMNLKRYVDLHSFLEESAYRENKWSFIVDMKMDYANDYDPNLFTLISDLLTFKANNRPNTSTLLKARPFAWFNRKMSDQME
eukprot:79046_1